jgi:hypothetical protein
MNPRFAVRAALGAATLLAGSAHALSPAEFDGTQLNVFYSGATATDNVLENQFRLITGGICAPLSPIGIYRVPTTNRNNRVIFCRVTASQVAGFPASDTTTVPGVETGGTKVAFHKESIGGSSNGVVPLFSQTNLEFFDMTQAALTCDAPIARPVTGTLQGYNEYLNCDDVVVSKVPDGGISDTEPGLSFPKPTAAQIAQLNVVTGLDIIFGVPVSENLYRALQVAQGILSDDSPLADGTCTVANRDTPACVPTLTKSVVRGLYTGAIGSWSQLYTRGVAGSENGVSITSGVGGTITPPANNFVGGTAVASSVFLCRRVATSGSQAAAESHFLKQRCETRSGTGALPMRGSNPLVGNLSNGISTVIAGESSGDVRTCLAAHNTNGAWAIGILSTEVNSAPSGWRFVGIERGQPNIASVMNGQYDYFVTNTLNRKTGTGAPTGNVLGLIQEIEANLGNKALIAAANVSFQGRPWGDGGLLLRYSSANARVPDAVDGDATTRLNPVNTQSHALVGGRINNCLDAVSFGSPDKGTLVSE